MPAVPVALAEAERRVAEIRRRLNRQALIEVLCPGIGAALCLLAALIAVAARGSAASFRGFAVAGGLALMAIAGGVVWALRRRMLSLDHTAHVVDRRAGMQERLTTLIWLKRSAHPSPLTSLLIADTFDSAVRWSPDAVAPRRFPWTALSLPAAGLIVLAATFLFLRHMPPQAPTPVQIARLGPGDSPAPPPQIAQEERGPGSTEVKTRAGGGRGKIQATINGEPGRTNGLERQSGRGGRELRASMVGDGSGRTQARDRKDTRPGNLGEGGDRTAKRTQPNGERSLSAGLQNKIREALGEKPIDAGDTQEARGRDGSPGESDNARRADAASRDGRRQSGESADELAAESSSGPAGSETASSKRPSAGEQREAQAGEPSRGRGGDTGTAHEGQPSARHSGLEGHAGQGSSPNTLFAPQGAGGQKRGGTETAQPPKAKSFKLMLSSFLSGSQAGNAPSKKGSDLDGSPGAPGAGKAAALNPNQEADDAVRRADIPPEYEDIIRRLYSSRTGD